MAIYSASDVLRTIYTRISTNSETFWSLFKAMSEWDKTIRESRPDLPNRYEYSKTLAKALDKPYLTC